MPKMQKKINAVVHFTNDTALFNLKEETNRLFAHTVQKYLENLNISAEEKKYIIEKLISELNT
ncbi:MAG: hypothetical protein J1F28_00715 [Oscillospiraceae bacterium]|nr:hypothetical protein [Oscillospiraceae bacterium]